MDIFGIVIFCAVAALLSLVLRQYKPEYAMMLSLACSAVVILYLIGSAAEITDRLSSLLDNTLITSDMMAIVIKCLGISILTELACQSCRDAGETAIAGKIELAGRTALVLASLPLFTRILGIASQLLSM